MRNPYYVNPPCGFLCPFTKYALLYSIVRYYAEKVLALGGGGGKGYMPTKLWGQSSIYREQYISGNLFTRKMRQFWSLNLLSYLLCLCIIALTYTEGRVNSKWRTLPVLAISVQSKERGESVHVGREVFSDFHCKDYWFFSMGGVDIACERKHSNVSAYLVQFSIRRLFVEIWFNFQTWQG